MRDDLAVRQALCVPFVLQGRSRRLIGMPKLMKGCPDRLIILSRRGPLPEGWRFHDRPLAVRGERVSHAVTRP